jgi:hypothetical protein
MPWVSRSNRGVPWDVPCSAPAVAACSGNPRCLNAAGTT